MPASPSRHGFSVFAASSQAPEAAISASGETLLSTTTQQTQTNHVWRPLRRATLVRLRWLAIVGQTISVLLVALIFKFPLPLLACLGIIGLSVALNIWMALGNERRLTDRFAAMQLGYDLLQLGGLLWLTGGLANPFSLLLLAPVSVSATTLTQRSTVILALLAIAIASLLAVSHFPLPWHADLRLKLDNLYLVGVWASILLGVGFVATYTNRVAHEARQLADALNATELTLSRQQQLSALDGLAAAAAHELGTPLSTIALAAKEMRTDLPDGPIADDVDLIITQADRCRTILAKLRSLDDDDDNPFGQVPLTDLVAEVATPLETPGKIIRISADGDTDNELLVTRNVGLLFGLGNIIENAVRFARRSIEVEVIWSERELRIVVTDDGPGFSLDLIDQLGEPYVSGPRNNDDISPTQGGLGLGIFIAKTLLERTGARLTFANAHPSGHARVEVHWPTGLVDEN